MLQYGIKRARRILLSDRHCVSTRVACSSASQDHNMLYAQLVAQHTCNSYASTVRTADLSIANSHCYNTYPR
eukprot:12144-Heterococcus_DN1.PRE.1